MKLAHIVFNCACAVFLSSCFSAGAKNTVIYTPRTSSPAANNAGAVDWHLRIDAPKSSVFLDSTRIAVRRENNILQVFEGARWADNVPNLLHNSLLQHFNNSGKITAISGLGNSTASDALLLLDIQQFEAVYTNKDRSASAVISVQANIQLQKTNRIIASKHFLISIPAENKKIPAVMSAFDTALEQLSQDVLSWILTADVVAKK